MRTSFFFLTLCCWLFTAFHANPCQAQKKGDDKNSRLNSWLDRMFKGKSTLNLKDLDSRTRGWLTGMLKKNGIKSETISRSQVTEMFQKMRKESDKRKEKESSDRKLKERSDYYFKKHDKNGDGILNYSEMSDTLIKESSKWDKSKDGNINKEEYTNYLRDYYARRSKDYKGTSNNLTLDGLPPGLVQSVDASLDELDKKPVIYRTGEELPKGLPSWFAKLDVNLDSQVSLYEWKSKDLSVSDFAFYDRNGDGLLPIDEVLAQVNEAKETGRPEPKGLSSENRSYDRSRWGRRR